MLDSSIPPWWIWANWASPLKYAFYVCMVNEFDGKQFECDSETACTFESGKELLKFYNMDNTDLKWPYVGVTFGMAVLFAFLLYFALRCFRFDKR